jgi:hypothetical protein
LGAIVLVAMNALLRSRLRARFGLVLLPLSF